MESLADLALYVVAVCVAAVTLGMSFEIAGYVFPGNVGKAAGQFFQGVQKYISTKVKQAQDLAKETAVSVAVTAATGSAATAAFVTKKLAERNEENREKDDIAHVEKGVVPDSSEDKSTDSGPSTAKETHFKTRDELEQEYQQKQQKRTAKDEWQMKAEQQDKEAEARAAMEAAMGGEHDPTVKLNRMAEDAYSWADRTAYLSAFHAQHRNCTEDVMAEIRDRMKVEEADRQGIKDEYLQLRETRLRENRFLMDMVMHQGLNTNNSLTARQKIAIMLLGEAKAAKYYDKRLLKKQLHGTPRLTSWGALFGQDTLTSAKADRQMLKNLGLYRDVQRAEMLRRMANSFLAPRIRPRTFMGISIGGHKYKFRNWLHKKLYLSCMKNLVSTEALIALHCREILADRDIHVNEKGKGIYIPNADLYWRRDIDIAAYKEAMEQEQKESFHDENIKWFIERYGSEEEARKMQLELEVFETKRRVSDADDFVLEQQLKARDEHEINLWKSINEDYHAYNRVKELIDKMVLSHKENNNG